MEDILQKAYDLAKEENYEAGLKICNDYIKTNPRGRDGYKQRSYIYARMNQLSDAIKDVSLLIDEGSREPDDYFSRGRWNLMVGYYTDAIKDFTEVINIEEKVSDSYYTETAYYYRAEANYKSGFYREATNDCAHVREGFTIHLMGQLRTREDILNDSKRRVD